MGIHSIRKDSVGHVPGSGQAKGRTRSAATAVKLSVVKSTRLGGRLVTKLEEAANLSKNIRRDWNSLDTADLAERIIDLENRVRQLKGDSPAVGRIEKEAKTLHFQFVFPVALELKRSDKSMPPSFATTVHQVAQQVLATHSLGPFQEFNPVQQQEIMRMVRGGEA